MTTRKLVKTALVSILACVSVPAMAEMVEYGCVTEASKDATLSFTVSGRITDIHHREGSVVEAGTPLVELEHRMQALEVERRKLVWEDKSELEAARIQSETLGKLLESTRSLFESTGSVSREELSRLELEAGTAQADLQRLQSAERREKVEYQLAVAELERRTLNAPFAGTIVDIQLNEGEISEVNQPLVTLVDVKRGFLICNIEEPTARTLSDGDDVPISIQTGFDRWSDTGEVVFVAPVVDPASGLLRVKIAFENANGVVRPGVPGYISLESGAPPAGSAAR